MKKTNETSNWLAIACALFLGGCVAGGGDGGGVYMGGGQYTSDAGESSGGADTASSSGGTSSGGTSSGGTSSGGTSSGGTSSGGTSSGGTSSGGTSNPTTGKFTGTIINDAFQLDYNGAKTTIMLKHRQASEGFACAPFVQIQASKPDGTCSLLLKFESDSTGVGKLTAASFAAKTINGSTAKACAGFIDPNKFTTDTEPMTFTLQGGNATMPMPLLKQPLASQTLANVPVTTFQPKGIAELQFKGIKLHLDLSQVTFVGSAQSLGDPNLACLAAQPVTYTKLPNVKLKDVNPKSATYGQTVDLNSFEGKYVVVLNGAGWCSSCIAQTKYMHKIEGQYGKDKVQMIAINDVSAQSPSQQKQLAAGGQATFPVLQATSSVGWKTMTVACHKKPIKNDAFIFAPNGQFIRKHIGKGTVYLNVFEDDVKAALNTSAASLKGCQCDEVFNQSAHKHYVTCK